MPKITFTLPESEAELFASLADAWGLTAPEVSRMLARALLDHCETTGGRLRVPIRIETPTDLPARSIPLEF